MYFWMQGVDSGHIVKNAYARYNLSIGVGLAKVAGKVSRNLSSALSC